MGWRQDEFLLLLLLLVAKGSSGSSGGVISLARPHTPTHPAPPLWNLSGAWLLEQEHSPHPGGGTRFSLCPLPTPSPTLPWTTSSSSFGQRPLSDPPSTQAPLLAPPGGAVSKGIPAPVLGPRAPPPAASRAPAVAFLTLRCRWQTECFGRGGNRGRGGRAGDDVWGKAGSPGQNGSRGTPDAVHSGPPRSRPAVIAPGFHPPETHQRAENHAEECTDTLRRERPGRGRRSGSGRREPGPAWGTPPRTPAPPEPPT